MFPKYKAGPINGDVVRDADLQREKMKVDISALLGGDVYSLLRDRSEKAAAAFLRSVTPIRHSRNDRNAWRSWPKPATSA